MIIQLLRVNFPIGKRPQLTKLVQKKERFYKVKKQEFKGIFCMFIEAANKHFFFTK